MVIDQGVGVLGPIIILLVYGLGVLMVYYVIRIAVRRGIRDALGVSESDLRRIVKRGVADALDEHESHEGRATPLPKPESFAE